MDDFDILDPEGIFEGRGYSDLIQEWANWLVSSSPDYQSSEHVLFLRGDLEYRTGEDEQQKTGEGLFAKLGGLRETIYKNTLVLIPIMTAMYTMNEMYEGKQLLDEASLRDAVRKDSSRSQKVWLRYQTSKNPSKHQVVLQGKRMEEFYFESSKFILSVKSDNPFREKFEYPLAADNYEAVQGGYFVALTNLKPDRTYRFHFGGYGRGLYSTDAVYDISVLNEVTRYPADDSSENATQGLLADKDPKVKKYIHLKNEDEIKNKFPPL